MMAMQPNAHGICVTYHATWIRQIPYLTTTSLATLKSLFNSIGLSCNMVQHVFLLLSGFGGLCLSCNMDQVDTHVQPQVSLIPTKLLLFPYSIGVQDGLVGVDNATHGGQQKLEAFCVVWFLFLEQRVPSWVILVYYLYFSIPFLKVMALLKFK